MTDNVSRTPEYQAGLTAGMDGEPPHGDSSFTHAWQYELWLWGWQDGRAMYRCEHGTDPPVRV